MKKEEQRMCGLLLVCPGCNLTIASQEETAVYDKIGHKYHNVHCRNKRAEADARRTAFLANQMAQSQSTQTSIRA